MKEYQLLIISFLLCIFGLSIFSYKIFELGIPLHPKKTIDSWLIETHINFEARKKPVKVTLMIPNKKMGAPIQSEHFVTKGYGLNTYDKEDNRQAIWTIRKAKGQQNLYYRSEIYKQSTGRKKKEKHSPKIESYQPKEPYLSAANSLINIIQSKSADLDSMISELLKMLNQQVYSEDMKLFLKGKKGKNKSLLKKLDVAVKLLAISKIPARIVHGFELKQSRKAEITHWLEVYFNKEWHSFDPVKIGEKISNNYLIWWIGKEKLLTVEGGKNSHVTFSISLNQEENINDSIMGFKNRSPFFVKFSVLSLPIETQSVFRIMLLIPLGVFLLVILRNFVGINSFGIFMPVLIALSFRETQLLWGIFLFSIMISIGLFIRFYLDRLKLLVVPRLASVLILMIFIISIFSIITSNMGIEKGLSIALFPIVIISMTIERMSIIWEEKGIEEAIKQGVGSLFIALITYLAMDNIYSRHVMFLFPELSLVLLSGTLLMGRYRGFRLLEFLRFKELTKTITHKND